MKIYQALNHVDSSGLRDSAIIIRPPEFTVSVAITSIPAHLTSGAFYLLVGKSGDDLTRMLFLPKRGPPEIKYLRVTLNQILDELAIRSAKALQAYLERVEYRTEEDGSDTGSEEASISADEDELRLNEEESSDTRSQEAAMRADDKRQGVSDFE